ncbi:hypothetical protein ES702_06958 [subsurface metagenome]
MGSITDLMRERQLAKNFVLDLIRIFFFSQLLLIIILMFTNYLPRAIIELGG